MRLIKGLKYWGQIIPTLIISTKRNLAYTHFERKDWEAVDMLLTDLWDWTLKKSGYLSHFTLDIADDRIRLYKKMQRTNEVEKLQAQVSIYRRIMMTCPVPAPLIAINR